VRLAHLVQQDLVDLQDSLDRMELQERPDQVVLLEPQVRQALQGYQVLLDPLADREHKVPLVLLGRQELRDHPALAV